MPAAAIARDATVNHCGKPAGSQIVGVDFGGAATRHCATASYFSATAPRGLSTASYCGVMAIHFGATATWFDVTALYSRAPATYFRVMAGRGPATHDFP